MQNEDEQRGEGYVYYHGHDGCLHGLLGFARRAKHGVQSQKQVSEYVAYQDYHHKVPGVGYGVVACAEESQNGVEKQQHHRTKPYAYYAVERYDVAEDFGGKVIVFLAELNRKQRASTHSHHCAEGCREVHDGHGYCQSHDCSRAYALSNENSVDNVVKR